MKLNKKLLVGAVAIAFAGGVAYANFDSPRQPVEFFSGHWHGEDGEAHGAPSHSGGLDRNGCHNKSVPYHCH